MTNVYFIGIGGIGMSAIARYYKHEGKRVSGYDKPPSKLTKELEEEGIAVHYTDDISFIPKEKEETLVIYTPAVPKEMSELVYVEENHYRTIKRSKALGEIAKEKKCLAVAGTHGKTTTSTLLSHIFTSSGVGCSAFLGGISKNYHSNLILAKSNYLVAEADEFDRSFLQLFPQTAIITSADPDHLDIYGTVENMRAAFSEFASQIEKSGYLIVKKGAPLDLSRVEEAFKKKAMAMDVPKERPSEYFGKYVFTKQKMLKYLPIDVYRIMCDVIDNDAPLDRKIADSVAEGMKRWAMELGATHCTHWFQPLTEGTAEKHDAFVEHDGKGGMIETFEGKSLVQQEPDASSFPNGGIRNTFEARGYSAWDPTSPVFVIGDTLCIPTIFISYTGEALDYKAPLLRALHAIDTAATDVCHLFYPEVKKVQTNLGWEQEYFLVDESLYSARPDLVLTGRTLMGHESAKNQQMDDHYFGTIPDRVQAFMKDLEIQALELAIPCKTRHNEVAPNQFELAPIFEETNLAVDHNMLLMSLMKRVARKHGFRALLHEKPFAGINEIGRAHV